VSQLLGQSICSDLGVVGRLGTQPVAVAEAEEAAQAQVGVGGDRAAAGDDLNGVFERLRDQASKQVDAAEAELKKGLALRKAGKIDDAIAALQAASRAPKLRFQTASLLGRIYVERKALPQAIEWFERAAQAPAPTAADGHLLLYELADALEGVGEVARALAICLELQADAGDYRDVSARVDRLSKVQTRG